MNPINVSEHVHTHTRLQVHALIHLWGNVTFDRCKHSNWWRNISIDINILQTNRPLMNFPNCTGIKYLTGFVSCCCIRFPLHSHFSSLARTFFPFMFQLEEQWGCFPILWVVWGCAESQQSSCPQLCSTHESPVPVSCSACQSCKGRHYYHYINVTLIAFTFSLH